MPRIPAELKLGRMRRLLRRLGDPHARAADHPHRRDQGQGLDGGDDGRGAVGLGRADRAVLLAPPAPPGGAVHGRRQAGGAATRWSRWSTTSARPSIGSSAKSSAAGDCRLDVLRDHDGDGPAPLRPSRRRRGRARGRHGRPAGFDQRRPPAAVDHHQHLVRPHAAARQHAGGDRHREGRDPQAWAAGRQRRAGAARPGGRSAAWPRSGDAACTSWAPTSASTRSRPNCP